MPNVVQSVDELVCSVHVPPVAVWSVHVSAGAVMSSHFKPPTAEKLLICEMVAEPKKLIPPYAVISLVCAITESAPIMNLPVAVKSDV